MFLKLCIGISLAYLCMAQISYSIPVIQPPSFSICDAYKRPKSSCDADSQCCDADTISVRGAATIQADPDIASISASIRAS